MKKPKVKYNAVLTRQRKLMLMYVWAQLRIDPQYGRTPEFRAYIMRPEVTAMLLTRDSEAIKFIRKLAGLVDRSVDVYWEKRE